MSQSNTMRHGPYGEYLVIRCMRSEREAFNALISLWHDHLLYYIRSIVSNEQESWDVAQNVWLTVFLKIHTLKDPRRFPAWVYKVARTEAMKYWRAKYRLREHIGSNDVDIDTISDNSDKYDFIDRYDNQEQVHECLQKISLPHREVLTLFFLEDLSMCEIADVLGLPIGSVKSRLHYARKALRAVLTKQGDQE